MREKDDARLPLGDLVAADSSPLKALKRGNLKGEGEGTLIECHHQEFSWIHVQSGPSGPVALKLLLPNGFFHVVPHSWFV